MSLGVVTDRRVKLRIHEHFYGRLGTCSRLLLDHHEAWLRLSDRGVDDELREFLIDQSYTYARCLMKGAQLYDPRGVSDMTYGTRRFKVCLGTTVELVDAIADKWEGKGFDVEVECCTAGLYPLIRPERVGWGGADFNPHIGPLGQRYGRD